MTDKPGVGAGKRILINSGHMLAGNGGKLLIQAVYFVLMGRSLGVAQYGAFVAVTSVAAVLYPFVGNGCGGVMIRDAARDPRTLPRSLGRALLLTFSTGTLFMGAGYLLCRYVLPDNISSTVVALILLSDILFCRFADVAAWTFQAVDKLGWTAATALLTSVLRLFGLVTIVLLHKPTTLAWAIAYAITAGISAAVALTLTFVRVTQPQWELSSIRTELKSGFSFSVGLSAQTIYNDMDKAMLARLSSLRDVGVYAAAYRIIDVAFVPVRSVLAATYTEFFRVGSKGVAPAANLGSRLGKRTMLYTCLSALLLVFGAPICQSVMGRQFADSVTAVRWLAGLLVLRGIHAVAGDVLTGSGHQGVRAFTQVAAAVLNVGLNLLVLPRFGWVGAAWTSIGCDAFLAAAIWIAVTTLTRRERNKLWSYMAFEAQQTT